MNKRFSRFFATALLAICAVSMVSVSFDAEARRFGGGKSFGKQSQRVTQNQPAATPPAAGTTQRSAASPAAAGAAAAGTAARSGMSRFLGPIMGIAAGLGIAALLSHLGLGGAFLEMMSSLIVIALVIFAIMFIVRRFRGTRTPATAMQGAAGGMRREGLGEAEWQRPSTPAAGPMAAPAPVDPPAAAEAPQDGWFIPGGFDTASFLANAKQQFIVIQGIWDRGDVEQLGEYLTDDLIAEFRPQIQAREGRAEHTEVVLLNAELLGIEPVAGGHLASVRYSGMLREAPGAEAFRFEEVWNLYKADDAGWLLAGIQQIQGQQAR